MEPNNEKSNELPVENENKPQSQQQGEEEEVTPETLQQFNKICMEATHLMNDYKMQSIALKQQIADMVSIYRKSSVNTDAVPVQKIISITNQYQQQMRQANQQYTHLAEKLRKEEKERDLIMFQIKDCFDKLERMELKIKEKKRREQEQEQKIQTKKQQVHQQAPNQLTNTNQSPKSQSKPETQPKQ